MSEPTNQPYPKEWLERVPARVFGCLVPGELRIVVLPGSAHANGGAEWNIRAETIPEDLRMPNTKLWLKLDFGMNILRVWKREDSDT